MLFLFFLLFISNVNPCERYQTNNSFILSCQSIQDLNDPTNTWNLSCIDLIELNGQNSKFLIDLDIFDSNKDLKIDSTFRLKNFNSIIIKQNQSKTFRSSFLLNRVEISNSTWNFEFYNQSQLSADQDCFSMLIFLEKIKLLILINDLHLMQIHYLEKGCSAIWHTLVVTNFYLYEINDENKFSFISNTAKIYPPLRFESLFILNSNLSLDLKFFDRNYWYNFNRLIIINSSLIKIENKLLDYLEKVEKLTLSINNFKEFIQSSENDWLNIRRNRYLNFSDCNSLKTQIRRPLATVIVLNDTTKTYDYPESDLCFFKHLNHSQLAFIAVYTQEKLKCTCTLVWLLLNWRLNELYNSIHYTKESIKTESVSLCFDNFDSRVKNCNFKKRLEKCGVNFDEQKFYFKLNCFGTKNSAFYLKKNSKYFNFIFIFYFIKNF